MKTLREGDRKDLAIPSIEGCRVMFLVCFLRLVTAGERTLLSDEMQSNIYAGDVLYALATGMSYLQIEDNGKGRERHSYRSFRD